MSWHCSLELVAEFSQAKVWVTGSCARWKKIRIAERSLCGGKKTNASQSSPSGTTLKPSTGTPGMALSMSFLLDSHANPSQKRAGKEGQTTKEIAGPTLPGSSEKFVQLELFSKTSHPSESTLQSLEILPIWGMTLNGELLPLEKPELNINEKDGGAWPTPRAANPGSRVNGKGGKILNEEVMIKEGLRNRGEYSNKAEWPTPTVNTRPNEGNVRLLRKQVLEGKLSEEEATQMLNGKSPFSAQGAVKEWPTPSATDSGGGIAKDTEISESGAYSRKNKDGVRWGVPLRDAVPAHEKNWPTPTASDHKGKNSSIRKDTGKLRTDRLDHVNEVTGKPALRLNPDWVEWLMGWPIGWTSLDFINIDYKGWWRYCMTEEPARYWEEDPADIPVGEKYHTPRLTMKKENRAQRLKCCGNGQVPQQLLLAMRVLCQERQTHGLQ
tara:strand:+ start:5650 stop:6966 length:1317 start_codon:yes stop_codon:yes gene_type:complete